MKHGLLRTLMSLRGFNQYELGIRLEPKRSQSWVSLVMTGKRVLTGSEARQIAEVLKVPPVMIFDKIREKESGDLLDYLQAVPQKEFHD